MSSFLSRLQEAIRPDYRRRQGDTVVVNRGDLCDIVHHFVRLDALPRAEHALGQLDRAGQAGGLMAGIAERLTHAGRGYTPSHDDEHYHGELAAAAAQYALTPRLRSDLKYRSLDETGRIRSQIWPFDYGWFKRDKFEIDCDASAGFCDIDKRKHELACAIALAAAEWDRLDRIERGAMVRQEQPS